MSDNFESSAPVAGGDPKLQQIVEFWIVSAPGDRTCEETYQKLHNVVKKNSLGLCFKFHIPDLKVGTLDMLVKLSEELTKLDVYVESITRKMVQYFADVLEGEKDKLKENLLVNGMTPPHYLAKFQWETAKYPPKQTLQNITEIIAKQVTQIDTDLKAKSQAYNALKGSIQNIERKAVGSLMTRALGEIVKKEDFVLDSEYLVTLIVVVPAISRKEWLAKYDSMTDMVVPLSSKLIYEDQEHCLYTVTLFRKVVDEYKHKCRENKFIVREFQYNEGEVEAGKNEMEKLTADKKKQEGPLIRWLKVNFAEAFIAWIHVKALRTYIESVLRYGLPVNFQAMILAPPRRVQKRLKEVLNQHYLHLDASGTQASKADITEIPGLNMSSSEYFPYVYFRINAEMVEKS
jgi:V-type H+-transporting ATPase subunit C